ncbi:MAG: hypothetical protein ABI455_04250 [Candidatus Dormiibacterota bacterium]
MKSRVVVVGALIAGLFAVAGPGTASANLMWCVFDPPVQVVTPGGHNLTVNNVLYLSAADRHNAHLVTDDASAAPDGHGGTLVTVHVHVPSAVHGAFTVSSNYRYQVSNSGAGTPGTVITLYLDVPTS